MIKVSEYSISPVQVQARAYKEGYGRGIVREVDNSCSSNPSYFNWLIIFTAVSPGQMEALAHFHVFPQKIIIHHARYVKKHMTCNYPRLKPLRSFFMFLAIK